MVKNIAVGYGHHNIRANSIAPGLLELILQRVMGKSHPYTINIQAHIPMRRIGEPDEVAGAAIMLASDAGKYINGQTIIIDGGATA